MRTGGKDTHFLAFRPELVTARYLQVVSTDRIHILKLQQSYCKAKLGIQPGAFYLCRWYILSYNGAPLSKNNNSWVIQK